MFKVLMFRANFYGRINEIDFLPIGGGKLKHKLFIANGQPCWCKTMFGPSFRRDRYCLKCKYNSIVRRCRLKLLFFFSLAIQISTISSRAFGQLFKIYQPKGK